MYLFKKYVEVYTTMDLTKLFTAKNLLDEHHIPFKDTSTSNQLRLSFNNFRGSNVQLSRDGSVKNIYSLSVDRQGTAHRIITFQSSSLSFPSLKCFRQSAT